MSFLTRLVGYGLCLFGAGVAGFYNELHSTSKGVNVVVNNYVSSQPDYNSAILAQVATYLQQTVPSAWATYVALGVAIAIGGAVIVAIGDRKPPRTESGIRQSV